MEKEQQEMLHDMAYFAVWLVFGAVMGWLVCYIAYGGTLVYEKLDTYGMFGAIMAVFWATFRRLKHVEHLHHIRKHLEKRG